MSLHICNILHGYYIWDAKEYICIYLFSEISKVFSIDLANWEAFFTYILHESNTLSAALQQQWQQLDAACDWRAIFSATYLIMTQYIKNAIATNYFSDNDAMCNMTVTFASRYMQAFSDYAAGKVQ
jgi:hypothetical protein